MVTIQNHTNTTDTN